MRSDGICMLDEKSWFVEWTKTIYPPIDLLLIKWQLVQRDAMIYYRNGREDVDGLCFWSIAGRKKNIINFFENLFYIL